MLSKDRCYRCGLARPESEFIKRRDGRRYGMCTNCLSEILARQRPTERRRLPHTETHRTCYLCDRLLENVSFTRRSNGTYFSACKECNLNVFAHRRRARMALADGSFTTAEWRALVARFSHCPECGRAWNDIPVPNGRKTAVTRDHVIPISKKGSNDISNLRPLCYSCNSRKGDRL